MLCSIHCALSLCHTPHCAARQRLGGRERGRERRRKGWREEEREGGRKRERESGSRTGRERCERQTGRRLTATAACERGPGWRPAFAFDPCSHPSACGSCARAQTETAQLPNLRPRRQMECYQRVQCWWSDTMRVRRLPHTDLGGRHHVVGVGRVKLLRHAQPQPTRHPAARSRRCQRAPCSPVFILCVTTRTMPMLAVISGSNSRGSSADANVGKPSACPWATASIGCLTSWPSKNYSVWY